jgi:hypothetical protein
MEAERKRPQGSNLKEIEPTMTLETRASASPPTPPKIGNQQAPVLSALSRWDRVPHALWSLV